MNDNKKLTSLIIVLVLTITVILGGTLAYWQWATSAAQETLVNVSLTDDAKMYIDFPSNELTNMYPTSDCEANGTSSWVTEITVDNGTGVLLSPKFKLKVKIQDKNGNIITNVTNTGNSNPNRHYIKFAVTGENESCKNALYTGRFDEDTETVNGNTDWYDSELITLYDEDTNFPIVSGRIGSGVSFYAQPNTQTKQRFRVYVWLDKDYVSVTQGTTSTDTMQDAKITVSWSENSGLEQVKKAPKTGEAIAIYSEDDKSLRFYREEDPSSVTVGSTYNGRTVTDIFTGFETVLYDGEDYDRNRDIPWQYVLDFELKKIIFEDYIYPLSTAHWFRESYLLEYIDLSKLDTSKTVDMGYMFWEISPVTLDVSHFNTSKVVNMKWMFSGVSVEYLDLSSWDTSNVTNMDSMFCYASIDNLVGLINWDTSNVEDFGGMFEDFVGDKTVLNGLENWDTSSAVNMIGMLLYNTDAALDLSGWNVCNVADWELFSDVNSDGEEQIETIIQPNFGNEARCNGNTNVGKENAVGDAYAVYSEEDYSLRFYRSLTPITAGSTFDGRVVTSVYTGFEDNTDNIPLWFEGSIDVRDTAQVIFEDYVYPTDTESWFEGMILTYADVTKLDMSNVTNMSYMFADSSLDTVIGLDAWDTSNVTNMANIFTNFDGNIYGVENWDVSSVVNMGELFAGNITNLLDLSGWDTSNVIDMNSMFNYFQGNVIGLENWDVSNVMDMAWMFQEASINNEIDLSGWNVCKIPTRPEDFSTNSNIIEPNWGMSC